MFIDTHCHLYDEKIVDNIDNILNNAKNNNVEKIIVAGCDEESCQKAVELANKYKEVYACIGVYPQYAETYDKKLEEKFIEMSKSPKVVGIGEIGLDYGYDISKEIQKQVFLKQLKLAYSLKLPVVIHGRDAYGDVVEILRENKEYLAYGGTFHCYTGSKELAKEIVKLGFFISVGGVSTFDNARKVKEMVQEVDLKNIILETDSPYLAPAPNRGKLNEPANILHIANNLAYLKCLDLEEIENQTTLNAKGLFRI